MTMTPQRFQTPPPRKAEDSPLACSLAAKSLMVVGKKDGDLSAQTAALSYSRMDSTRRGPFIK